MPASRVVVIGGGIAGLACAWDLARAGLSVTVVDASDRPGGKLRREPVAGVPVDVGAESVLARRPEAVDLATELGLGDDLVSPVTTTASIWSRGELHPMPRGTLMGIPASPQDAAGILAPEEVDRAAHETPWDPAASDVSVGDYVAHRLGDAVVDRLVEPLLGGVYAGRARELSLQACLPQVHAAAREGRSLSEVARATAEAAEAARAATVPKPVFASLGAGVGVLAETLVERLRAEGVEFRSGTIARELHRVPGEGAAAADRWAVVVGPRPAPERLVADAVVVAVPAVPASRLLAPLVPSAATELAAVPYASMAIVTLAVAADTPFTFPGSGFLVPAVDGRAIKASTFSTAKWGRTSDGADDLTFLRASIGRYGETADLQRADEDLVAIAVAEVSEALGHQLPRLVDSHVQRWGGALPQYTVGHVDRVRRVREAVGGVSGLELAGAAYDGVGIPATIGGAREAARAVLTHLRGAGSPGGQ